tara:strand:+ start:5745 stop:5936 length:192 start_codon:yes stop_codon:yes gene_type:complete
LSDDIVFSELPPKNEAVIRQPDPIAADVFPDFAAGELTHTFEVQAADLKALIRLDAIAEQKRR